MRRRIAAVAAVSIITACGGTSRNDPNLAAATDPSSSLQSSPSVYGTVRDAAGVAIAGASVSDGQRSVTTQGDGTYTLSESAGTYALTASKTGYGSATQAVTVPKRGGVSLDWTLTATASSQGAYKVLANNDLGMHCVDKSFAVFSILPPYNVVDAQVVALKSSGDPVVLDASQVQVRYSAIADATGSINSTSKGKSDFWQFVSALYGAALPVGEGLQGLWMPADAPSPAGTTLSWDTTMGLFKAPGIPIFPVDDAGAINRYPLMRFSAYDKSGNALGSTDVVLPVSEETSCQNCHATGQVAASDPKIAWSQDASDLEAQARRNVLILHNARTGTTLQAPVLCATCHYSPALDLAGTGQTAQQAQHGTMSKVMHAFHSDKMAGLVDSPVAVNGKVPSPTTQACYQCHPGVSTQCLRGAMTSKVDCQNCHGNMAAVGGVYPLLAGGSIDGANDGKARRPWLDLPRCQSCHANDAVTKTVITNGPPLASDGIRFNEAYRPSDPAASPLLATNTRFAEEPGKLYRKSKGHGGLACEGCHGSTHAVWAANANDNVAATQLQGHAGTVAECGACHVAPPANGLGGPHGMHPVGSAWVSAHPSVAQAQLTACQACHGTDYRGTVLSRMFATRSLAGHTLTAGTAVGCYTCHNGPNP
ncbi:MAG TPA: carboxypeptidase-like regulatory domain-containing protein [Anaeromyxobacteraceae bacterium]